MTRTTIALTTTVALLLAGPALAQTLAPTGGAGNTGVTTPSMAPMAPREVPDAPEPTGRPAQAIPSPASVPGSAPGVNIGGTPTSGPPGTGGTSGGPSLGNR